MQILLSIILILCIVTPTPAAVQVGRADAVVLSTDTVTTTIDVNVGFTPTAGKFFVLAYASGRTEATDTVGSANIVASYGMAVSSSSRGGVAIAVQDANSVADTAHQSYTDAVLKTLNDDDGTTTGALDFNGDITNGVQFIVDDQFPQNLRFQVIVIDGLTDAGITTLTSPATAVTTDHTGFGVDDADLFFFMSEAPNAGIGGGSGGITSFGAAHADGQFVVAGGSRDSTDTNKHYAIDTECFALTNVIGAPIYRASFNSAITDGVKLDWNETAASGHVFIGGALKGVEATIQNSTTQTDTVTDIAITGLGNTALGGLVVSAADAESTSDTGSAHHSFTIGSFDSTSDRGAHAYFNEDDPASGFSESTTAVEYDAVYINMDASDAIEGLMDIKSLDSGGATFIMDDADPSANWFATVLFADVVGGAVTPKMPLMGVGP